MIGMKYVVYSDDTFVIFPHSIKHSDMRLMGKTVAGAGFTEMNRYTNQFACYGESESLKIKSRPEEDSAAITEGYFISMRLWEKKNV